MVTHRYDMLIANIIFLLLVVIGLFSIPFGLPGLMIVAIGMIGYEVVLAGDQFSTTSLIVVGILSLASELLDCWLTARMTSRAGASRRGSWGALLGGIIGAIVGLPIPIIGSILGSLAGLFVGAYIAERLFASHQKAAQIGGAALASRLISTAIKFAVGVGVLIWVIIVIL